jgi:hypothetical protein
MNPNKRGYLMYDLETQIKVAEWRRKAILGTLTPEEMIESTRHLMQGRKSAAAAASASKSTRAKSNAPQVSGDDLLEEMMKGLE